MQLLIVINILYSQGVVSAPWFLKLMKRIIVLLLTLLTSLLVYPQKVTISGFVYDSVSTEPLYNAYIINAATNDVALSNEIGYFSITANQPYVDLKISYVGFETFQNRYFVTTDTLLKVYLISNEIDEVKVVADKEPLFRQVMLGSVRLPVKDIETAPSMFGEPDLMKMITSLPGITGGREGLSTIYVRGGDRDQNLILMDGVKIYNSNHLGGLLSIVNADVIRSVDVYKGGFPSRFGGRLSSVIDIQLLDGNKSELKGKYSIGVLQSSLLLDGPVRNDKTTFILGLRASYLDLFLLPWRIKYNKGNLGSMFGYTFFDLNFKITHEINTHNKVSIGLYTGHDIMTSESFDKFSDFTEHMAIGTSAIKLEHNAILSSKTRLKNQAILSKYGTRFTETDNRQYLLNNYQNEMVTNSYIDEIALKSQLEWYPSPTFSFLSGLETSVYSYSPSKFSIVNKDYTNQFYFDTIVGVINPLRSFELSAFVQGDVNISDKIKLTSGLRSTYFLYDKTPEVSLEPRISFRILTGEHTSIKLGLTKMVQNNLGLVSNYQGFEREVWIPASDSIPRQRSWQYSAGFFGESKRYNMEYGIEVFYKSLSDLYRFSPPVEVFEDFSQLTRYTNTGGTGYSYGAEFSLYYSSENVSLNFAYTILKSIRKFQDINQGNPFPSDFDRPHDLSLTSRVRISDRYTINSSFIFSSGAPFTIPESYTPDNQFYWGYYNYADLNNVRLPAYHRLDIGIERNGITKNGNKKKFLINIFNVYARQNPVYIYQDPYNGKTYQLSLFSILPTISYSAEF
jgi:hypothetical protein